MIDFFKSVGVRTYIYKSSLFSENQICVGSENSGFVCEVTNVHWSHIVLIEGASGYLLVQSMASIMMRTTAPVKTMDFVVIQTMVELNHIDSIIRYRAFRGNTRSVSQL